MNKTFGIWEVDEDYGITGKVNPNYDYNIGKYQLWDTKDYGGRTVWSWLIHLANKSWITLENVSDLNKAFLYGQEYFKECKPKNIPMVSTEQTLNIQKQLLEIREQLSENDSIIEGEYNFNDGFERMKKYQELLGNIKFLDI